MTGYNTTLIMGDKPMKLKTRFVGLSTNFKLDQIYEIGDLKIYENTGCNMSERNSMICFENGLKNIRLRVKGDLTPTDFVKCLGNEKDNEYLAATMVSKLIGLGFETSIVFDNNAVTPPFCLGWAYNFYPNGKLTGILVGVSGGANSPIDREAFRKWATEWEYSKWIRKLVRITWTDGRKHRVFIFAIEGDYLKGYTVDDLVGHTATYYHFATSQIASIEEIV